MHEPRHKEHIDVQNTTTSAQTGLRFIVNGTTARDIVAFGDEIVTKIHSGPSARTPTGLRPVGVFNVDGPSARRSSPSATKFTQTGLWPVVRSERAYGP